jgi:hypothetical protein
VVLVVSSLVLAVDVPFSAMYVAGIFVLAIILADVVVDVIDVVSMVLLLVAGLSVNTLFAEILDISVIVASEYVLSGVIGVGDVVVVVMVLEFVDIFVLLAAADSI